VLEDSMPNSGRGRGIAAWVIFTIAAILLPIALTAFWAQRTLTDTERYVATVAPLSEDPTIQQAVSTLVTDKAVAQLDVQNRLDNILPPALHPLAPILAGGVTTLITRGVDAFLTSPDFHQLWVTINQAIQRSLVAALSGSPTGPVTIQGDQVILDTGDALTAVKQKLVDRGIPFAADIPIPPKADREVVLMTSPQLATARTAYAIGQPVAQWLIFAVLALFILALILVRNRPRMVVGLGIAALISAVLLKAGLAFGESTLSDTLAGTPLAIGQQAFYSIMTVFLLNGTRALFVVGLVLVGVGWFLGNSSTGRKARALADKVGGSAGAALSDSPVAAAGTWVAKYRGALYVGLLALLGIMLVFFIDPVTPARVGSLALLAVLVAVGIEVLARSAPSTAANSEPAEVTADATQDTAQDVAI
jgi:hypothetical protein